MNEERLSTVCRRKFIEALDNDRFAELFWGSTWTFLTVNSTLIFSYPDKALQTISSIMVWNNHFVPFFIVSGLFWYYSRWLYLKHKGGSKVEQIMEDISETLAKHIITEGSAKYNDMRAYGLNSKQYKSLMEKLDIMGLTERGENNQRIFKEGIDVEQLQSIIGTTLET